MSFHLAKCIDVTPQGTLQPASKEHYVNMRAEPWSQALVDSVSHVRFWADWPSLAPIRDEFGTGPGAARLAGLDACVRKANEDGLKVIMLPYRYPRWVNGTDVVGSGSDANIYRRPEDRCTLAQWRTFLRDPTSPSARNTIVGRLKTLEYEMPPDGHGPMSRWAGFVEALLERYVRHADTFGRIDYFEVVNEPNFQLWPQLSPATDSSWPTAGSPPGRFGVDGSRLVVHEAVADMMETVDELARRYEERYDRRVLCLAPSTADHDRTNRRLYTIAVNTPWSASEAPFVDALLDELDRRRFKGGSRWIWSYHNYADMEREHDKATYMRDVLGKRWRGRTRDGGPAMMATEGGVRLSQVQARFGPMDTARLERVHAAMLAAGFKRHRRSTGNGAGVELLTQYTVHADRNFDTGLRNLDPPHSARPAFEEWRALEELDPHDPSPSQWRPDDTVEPFDPSTVP